MTGEKLFSRLSFYIIAITLLMLLGLVHKEGPLRGFPLPWVINMRHVMMEFFIPSLLLNTAVVLCSDFLARLFIRVKEPSLKIHTKLAEIGKTDEETIEMSVNMNSEPYPEPYSNTVPDDNEDEHEESSFDIPEIKTVIDEIKKDTGIDNKKKGSLAGFIIALIAIFTFLPFIMVFTESDDFFNDDDIVIEASWDDSYEGAESAVIGNSEYLFEKLMDADKAKISELFSDEETEAIFDYTDWSNLSYQTIDTYISEDESFSISKYYVNDNDDNQYLMAIYMQIEKDGEDDDFYKATIKGLALCPDVIGLDDSYDYTNKVLIENFKEIASNETLFGDAKKDGASILVWDPYTDVFGRSRNLQSSEDV